MQSSRILIIASCILLLGAAFVAAGNSQSPEVRISSNDDENYLPQAAYNSTHDEYFVVWHVSSFQGRYVMGRRIDSYGKLIAEYTIAFEDTPPRDNAQPTIAYDPVNDRYLVAWVHDILGDASDWDVMGRFVPWNGPTPSLTTFAICVFASNQWNPRATYAGSQQEFLVTWWNEATGGVSSYISAARIDPSNGSVLATMVVASGSEDSTSPDVAYNQARNEYLIVYQLMDASRGDIAAVRLNAGGSILGGGEFGIATWPDPETQPRVTASRITNQWMVVWESEAGNPANLDVYGRRLWVSNAAGDIQQAAPVAMFSTAASERNPEVACYPESGIFAVSCEDEYPNGYFGISAKTMDTSNRLGEFTQIRPAYLADTIDSTNPAMAAGPSGFLTTWVQDRQDSSSIDIYGRVMWQLYSDGFESGDLSRWTSVSP